MHWQAAQDACTSESATLASVHDEITNAALAKLIGTNGNGWTWLGGYQETAADNADWKWTDRSDFYTKEGAPIFTKWGSRQPDNNNKAEHHLGFYHAPKFSWNDFTGNHHTLPFICQYDAAIVHRSFKHLVATTGVTTGTGTSDTESVSVGSDDFNIKDLYTSSYKLDADNTITSADFTIKDELTVSKDVEVGGKAENVDVLALASDIVIDAAKDLTITPTGGSRVLVDDAGIAISNNKSLATITEWGEEFGLDFELYVESFTPGWTELLRVTSTENGGGSPGDRIPAVFIKDGKMGVRTQGQIGKGTFGKNFNINLQTWTRVKIIQVQVENKKWVFKVIIDGKSVWEVENDNPMKFHYVAVYAARDKWFPIANARIRNFVTSVIVSSNSQSISVPGKKTFSKPLTVTNDITTSGHLVVSDPDGSSDRTFTSGDLAAGIYNRILRKTGAAQTVSTNIVLDGNVKIGEDLQADSIDGVAFSAISAKYEYNSADGTHEVKTAFNFSGDAITVTDLETSSVRGRDWSGFVKDIISKECTDYKVVIGGATLTFKFTGQYSGTKPVFGYGGFGLIYVSDQWQLENLKDGSVLGSVKSESNCPEVSGWTWTDGSTKISQGISNFSMM